MSSYKGPFILTDPEGYDVSLTMFSSASAKISYIDKDWVQHDETISNTDGFDKKKEFTFHHVLFLTVEQAALGLSSSDVSDFSVTYNFSPVTKKRLTKNYKDYFAATSSYDDGEWGDIEVTSTSNLHSSDSGCQSATLPNWGSWSQTGTDSSNTYRYYERTGGYTYYSKLKGSSSSNFCVMVSAEATQEGRQHWESHWIDTHDSGGSSKPSDATTD